MEMQNVVYSIQDTESEIEATLSDDFQNKYWTWPPGKKITCPKNKFTRCTNISQTYSGVQSHV